ncbi:hypothetical protein J4H86_16650 [Spiractinospora alimapuensis]|uniref:hypothetical protein n=1 Tax=Spiractinospora alimapuensis TaxID=2820884 RepID=UPI001F2E7A7A|nr:hypothetical protein [Spiractinospora alimapuensis]QVQ50530.1 hypothetical protein J4H86_16650 [Spiractinospora alimapuensis]
MRVTPSPSLHRYALRAGAVVAAGALLAGCSDDGSLDVDGAQETVDEAVDGAQEAADDATSDTGDEADSTDESTETADSESDGDSDDSWWDTVVGWFSGDDDDASDEPTEDESSDEPSEEESPEETEDPDAEDEPTEEESPEEDAESDDSWWDTIVGWFSGDDDEDADAEDDEDEEGEEEAASYGFPESCAEAGAAEAAGDLLPFGAQVQEDSGEFEAYADARYLICSWDGQEESFTLIYTENADPSGLVNLAGESGEQEMNWEVDVDMDVENYRSTEADELGGDLDYSSTVDGNTQIMHLSLPDNFWVAGVSVNQDVEQPDLERVVYDAAERL